MNTNKTSEEINRDRRRFVETAAVGIAAAGSFGLLPKGTAAATEGDAIRPFRVDVPEETLVDLRRRITATNWPERETVTDETQGVQFATIQKLARYWANRSRLAQGRGATQRLAAVHDRDRRAGHSLHSRSFET